MGTTQLVKAGAPVAGLKCQGIGRESQPHWSMRSTLSRLAKIEWKCCAEKKLIRRQRGKSQTKEDSLCLKVTTNFNVIKSLHLQKHLGLTINIHF